MDSISTPQKRPEHALVRSNDFADAARFAESLKAKGTRRADPPDASHSRPCFGGHDGTLSARTSHGQLRALPRGLTNRGPQRRVLPQGAHAHVRARPSEAKLALVRHGELGSQPCEVRRISSCEAIQPRSKRP